MSGLREKTQDSAASLCCSFSVLISSQIGAGFGELVIVVSGSSARSAAGDMNIPVDAAVVAIVDNFDLASGEKKGTK